MSTETPAIEKYPILHFRASNIKRLRIIDYHPNPGVNDISGRNDQGKSSLLDTIWWTMKGAKSEIGPEPLRQGADTGEGYVDFGAFRVWRKIKRSGSPTLKVEMADGSAVESPQAFLDSLAPNQCFDPLAFTRLDKAKLLETLRKLVGLDFTKLDKQKADHYAARTAINRDLANAQGRLNLMKHHPDAPAEKVSVQALMLKQKEVREFNRGNQQKRACHLGLITAVNDQKHYLSIAQNAVRELEAKLSEAKVELLREEHDLRTAEDAEIKSSESLKTVVDQDESAINSQIEAADDVNAKVKANADRTEACNTVTRLNKESEDLTAKITAIESDRKRQLSEAKFPLEGLSFDDSGVLLDGVPFEQAGMAKKILASLAIAQALNPRLPVILIRDGSLLDEDSMAAMEKFAQENKLQIWRELVGKGKGGIVIEDGKIVEEA